MANIFKRFLKEEDGLATVEIVIIIAVLVGIAIIFRDTILGFVKRMLGQIFPDDFDPTGNGAASPNQ